MTCDTRKTLSILLLSLLLAIPVSGQVPLKVLDGPALDRVPTMLERGGAYVTVYHQNRGDTLRAWVQHVTTTHVTPDYGRAEEADLVIWCYPGRYPHPNHVMPDAEGRLEIMRSGDQLWVREVNPTESS